MSPLSILLVTTHYKIMNTPCAPLVNEFDNIIVVHSFTKFYAVPGLRIGAAFSNSLIIEQLNSFIPTWSVNTLAQSYTEAALNDVEYVKRTKQVLHEEQLFMHNSLDTIDGITDISAFS